MKHILFLSRHYLTGAIAIMIFACSPISKPLAETLLLPDLKPTTAIASASTTYKIYKHPQAAFQIDIPQHWQLYRATPTEAIFVEYAESESLSLIWIKFEQTEKLFASSITEAAVRAYAKTLWTEAETIDLSLKLGDETKSHFLFRPSAESENHKRMMAIAGQDNNVGYIIGGITNDFEHVAPIWQHSLATFQLDPSAAKAILNKNL